MKDFYTTSSDLEALRLRVLERFCVLLGHWTRVQAFRNNAKQVTTALLSEIVEPTPQGVKPELEKQRLLVRCARLNDTLELLHENQQQNWDKSRAYLKENMLDFSQVTRDLTNVIKELEYYAVHDPLTRLFNRRYFYETLEQEIARCERHHREFSLLLIDLDNFKVINDTYGHLCGDSVLQNLSTLVHHHLRSEDVLARIGGDEFSVILVETEYEVGRKVAQRLQENISKTLLEDTKGNCFHLTLSIGIARYPKDATDAANLLNKADVALLRIKRFGRNGIAVFDETEDRAESNLGSHIYVEKLWEALDEGRIVPYYQPIIRCDTGELEAYEVLARLCEPSGKVVPAKQFINTIEKFGLGTRLAEVILAKVSDAFKLHLQKAKKLPRLFVNLSLQEIQNPTFWESIEATCNKYAIPTQNIVFEILERDLIDIVNITDVKKQLPFLAQKGFSFALDDFGGGYKSFHYLRDLPFSYVKISGYFVRSLLDSKADSLLVRDASRLCQELGIISIAASVKSEVILKELHTIGIKWAQGYYIGRPAPKMDENFVGPTFQS